MGMIATIFSQVSVLCALFAACLWACSAMVNLPVIGSAYSSISNLEPFYAALKKVARLNAGAASCAFASAVAQAVALYLST
jgi:hypothetical protein